LKRFYLLFLVIIISLGISFGNTLNEKNALKFSKLALKCIVKEFPNKPSHVLNDKRDIKSPKELHPCFYGCFDWHSSVHGHWLLVKVLNNFPNIKNKEEIRNKLIKNLTENNILKEVEYLHQKNRKSFERTYGWAWFLKLVEELDKSDLLFLKKIRKNLIPLENEIVKRYMNFFPKQVFPIRTGVHPNTAFGISFALDYSRQVKNKEFEEFLLKVAKKYYSDDKLCPLNYEPGGEDFFSPCLIEASLMSKVLNKKDFTKWFKKFIDLNHLKNLQPAIVLDRSDGKLVHLDGLNLSRAWCLKNIFNKLVDNNLKQIIKEKALIHAKDGLKSVMSGDYAGEHWLASFAVYYLSIPFESK